MSQHSTSKMLGKLAPQQNRAQSLELGQEIEEVVEDFAVPQLTPVEEPKMANVLNQILGMSFSKKRSPIDK